MKRILKRLCVVATALAMSFGLSQCAKDNDAFIETPEGQVYVTLTASKGEMTKTSLEQNTDNDLVVKWTTGDKLYAVGETDGFLGSLVLTDGDGETSGKFGGNINYLTSKQNVRFYYVGKSKSIDGNTYTLNLDNQDGSLASIADTLHLMCGSVSNASPTMVNLETVTMSNIISVVKVDTKTAFGEVEGIKLSGSVNKGVVDLKTGSVTPTTGDITLTGTAANNCYIALLANGLNQTFNFSYDGQSRHLDAKQIVAGKYYTDSGNSVQLNEPFEFVDLGLSVLWANMNLGASRVTGYGDYYAWGEVEPYHADGYSAEDPVAHWRSMTTGAGNTDITGYNWHTYSQGGKTTFVEWTTKPYDETTRNLLPKFDAANYVIPGSHIPTLEEWEELKSNCSADWTTDYNGTGIQGLILTSKVAGYTDKSIFLPAAGYVDNKTHGSTTGERATYMSSTRNSTTPSEINSVYIYKGYFQPTYGGQRNFGRPVRAVKGSEEFSVGDSKKVSFVKGNLYIDKTSSPYVWRIEENQYDYRNVKGVTNDASIIKGKSGTTPANTQGLFFYSKTPSATYPIPYSDPTYATGDIFFTNETESTPNPSFSVVNNGVTCTGLYRVLSKDEWNYLLQRDDKCEFATINVGGVSIKGCIILPDVWTLATITISHPTEKDSYTYNTFTEAQWKILENAGAIFLPASNYLRFSDTTFTDYEVDLSGGYRGDYWSSKSIYQDAQPEGVKDVAYYYHFAPVYSSGGKKYFGITTNHIQTGQAVRLVKDCN